MAQFRTTRRIDGLATMVDGQDGLAVPTSIGLSPDWRKPGPVWEIPYGTLLPRDVSGLLVAGRCISSGGDAWEVTRVIPTAALTGQVAGIAARLAVSRNTTPEALDAGDVQAELVRLGIPFHISDSYRLRRFIALDGGDQRIQPYLDALLNLTRSVWPAGLPRWPLGSLDVVPGGAGGGCLRRAHGWFERARPAHGDAGGYLPRLLDAR